MIKNNINRIFFSVCILLVACKAPTVKNSTPSIGSSKYSKWLSYSETEFGVQVCIKDPDGKQPMRILLCTTEPHKTEHLKKTVEVIDVRSLRFATNAATHVGMLVALKERNRIGAVSMGKYLHDQALKAAFSQGKIFELGQASIPFEKLVQQRISMWVSAGMEPMDLNNRKRFESLGMAWIPDYDWREPHPLGKAEWLLLFGALTNRFDEAKTAFDDLCKRYDECKKWPKGNACEKVLVGNFAGESWYSPLRNSFQAWFLTHVDFCTFSMNYEGTGSLPVGAERLLKEASSCTLWLNPGFPTKEEILRANPKANKIRPFKDGRIFCYSHDLNKYWEQSALMPDKVLNDLMEIKRGQTNPSLLYFYREVK